MIKQIKLVGKAKESAVLVRITRDGKKLVVSTGSAWGNYKNKVTTYGSPEKARDAYDKALAAKREAGYLEVGGLSAPQVSSARNERLEAAIRAGRSDDAYMVYADWLQGQGSAVGELIAFAQRGQTKKVNSLAAKVGMPDPEFATVTWKHGLWQTLRINNEIDSSDVEWDPLPAIRALFASPLCVVIDELRIGMVRWHRFDQPDIVALAGEFAWAKDLRSLAVGDVGRNIDMNHHSIGDVGKRITQAFPHLESLFLHSGAQGWRSGGEPFGTSGLALPKLQKLVVETCAMSSKRVKGLLASSMPQLKSVELWFGDPQRGTPLARLGDLVALFGGKAFPKLEHLGLCNTALVTEIVRYLPESKLARQLTSLDLSRGTFYDEDATELAATARAFPKLTALDLSRSFLTKAGIAKLKKAFPKVTIAAKDQHSIDEADEDYGGRFVSVSE